MIDTNYIITEISTLFFVIALLFWTGVFGKNLFKVSPRLKMMIGIIGLGVSAFFFTAAYHVYTDSVSKSYFHFLSPTFLMIYFIVHIIKAIRDFKE
jgi:hypothetical protein